LDDALEAAGDTRRRDSERIALVVPRRNIESWIHFAETREIDETTDFKPRYRETKARNAADAVLEACRSGADETTAPPSLVAACRELRRVVPP
jgi:hypothetical protein